MKQSQYRYKLGNCLACNKFMDSVTGPAGGVPNGSIMICAYCSHVMQWNGKKFIELSPEIMEEIKDMPDLKEALTRAKLFQAWKQKTKVHVIVLEPLEPEICEECGQFDECRPYGRRKANGIRKWVCFPCARKDEAELQKAFDERMEGKNPTFPGEGQ